MLAEPTLPRPGRITRLAQNFRLHDGRNMVWSWCEPVNFGDWVGPFLFEARTGTKPLHHKLDRKTGGTALVTAGSIMAHIRRADAAIVWGAGIITRADVFERPREIRAVRGPLTRARCLELGYDCPEIYGDPAILLPRHLDLSAIPVTDDLGLVPHFVNLDEATRLFGDRPGIRIIDVRRPLPEVCAEIAACRAIVSSSLHGVIVAQAYGRPAARVTFAAPLKGDGVKFADHYAAFGITDAPEPARLDGSETTAGLLSLAEAAPRPDIDALTDRLAAACPF